jgi:ferrous iron transport protein A
MTTGISARNSQKKQVMPLAFLKRGESGVVNAVNLGDDVRKKLISLGICQNSEVTICSESCGAVIVNVGSAHYALSRATAMKIMVGTGGSDGTGNDGAILKSRCKNSDTVSDNGGNSAMPYPGTGAETYDFKKVAGTI